MQEHYYLYEIDILTQNVDSPSYHNFRADS